MGEGVVERAVQASDPQFAKSSLGSDRKQMRTNKALNFGEAWTNLYGN